MQVPPICYNCKHRKPKESGPYFCAAFPGGIPYDIINNVADHRRPFPNDRGIRFDPIDPDAPFPAGFEPQPTPTDGSVLNV